MIPSRIRVVTLCALSVMIASYTYLPGAMLAVVFAAKSKVTVPFPTLIEVEKVAVALDE